MVHISPFDMVFGQMFQAYVPPPSFEISMTEKKQRQQPLQYSVIVGERVDAEKIQHVGRPPPYILKIKTNIMPV